MQYKHLFFDMDKTIAPARQPIKQEMFDLLSNLPHDIVIVSGQSVDKIKWQSNSLNAFYLGQNGNFAVNEDGEEMWQTPLTEKERAEVMTHIDTLVKNLPDEPNPDYTPVEDRGSQITFSPVGNTAPVAEKQVYDPDAAKRLKMLSNFPFVSETMLACIGGSTSIDYIPKTRHKGTNVAKLIEHMDWNKNECVYFGDGLFPGGNDEFVIGVIDTIPVTDEEDCFAQLTKMLE